MTYSRSVLRSLALSVFWLMGVLCMTDQGLASDSPSDLTGTWKADNGAEYHIRQLGSDLYWSMDGRPRVANIFIGRIEGNLITGRWVDVPGGQLLNSGTLTLRIESADRLVKVSSSIAYGESMWTRVGAAAPVPSSPLPPVPAASSANPINWDSQGRQWRGQSGRRETLACPPGGPSGGRLWGTDIYTDDSSICLAAVHAGVITSAGGGTVTIEIRPGQPSYVGTTRNGMTSQAYGPWEGSMAFVAADSPAPPPSVTNANWGTQADQWRGQNGRRETLACPPNGPVTGRLWGTDIYTDDSSICLAAAHAGLITVTQGGTVSIEIKPGQASYTGSARNGVTSQGYGGYAGSFSLIGAASTAGNQPASPSPSFNNATWGTQADQWRGQNGRRETLICPPGGPAAGRLWGTDIYTDDSSICLAAVHAGVITAAAGGLVGIEIRPGQPSYVGSGRNGVTSQNYGNWPGSFVFASGPAGSGGPAPAARGLCDDPKTLAIMDEWLSRALPQQREGESLRYEAWGRLVGRSQTASLTVSGQPDTRLSRCEYLWQHAPALNSTNLGTLRDYIAVRAGQ